MVVFRILPLLLALLVSSLSHHPAFAGEDGNGDGILLGMSAAFSGPSRELGIELYRGSMAYFDYLNEAQDGILGKKIRIIPRDDGYNPCPAVRNSLDFIEENKVLGLFNYVGTPTVTRVLPLLKKYSGRDIFLFFPFTGAQPQREEPYGDYVFNLRPSYRQETQELVDRLVSLGRTRIAVFYQVDAYGRSGWDGVRRALAKHGLKIAAEATYRRGTQFTQRMSSQVDIIVNARPDAVITIASYEACAAFIRDARDAGLDVPIANISFVGSESLLDLLGQVSGPDRNYTENLINTQTVPSYEDLSLPAVREYRQIMERHAPGIPPGIKAPGYVPSRFSFVSFEGFLNAKVFAGIIEKFGRVPERNELLKAVRSLNGIDVGIEEPVRFGPDRHQGLNRVYFTTVENSRFMPIRDWKRWTK